MSWTNWDEVFERLEELGGYQTVSDFAVAYYDLIADYLYGSSRASEGLRLRLEEFLEVLGRYHRALDVFTREDQVTLGNVRAAAEKRDIALEVLLEQLSVDAGHGEVEIGRLLLTAECCYQLGLVERVVERLEAAVEAGASHPLVLFALGYNRYGLATHAFTEYDSDTGQRVVHDEDRFRLACLSAVSVMQDGLTGGAFDGQLHWWIGTILHAAGFAEAARASLDKAAEIDRQLAMQLGIDDDSWAVELDIERDFEYDLGRRTHPITEDEVRRAAYLLRRSYTASDILDE